MIAMNFHLFLLNVASCLCLSTTCIDKNLTHFEPIQFRAESINPEKFICDRSLKNASIFNTVYQTWFPDNHDELANTTYFKGKGKIVLIIQIVKANHKQRKGFTAFTNHYEDVVDVVKKARCLWLNKTMGDFNEYNVPMIPQCKDENRDSNTTIYYNFTLKIIREDCLPITAPTTSFIAKLTTPSVKPTTTATTSTTRTSVMGSISTTAKLIITPSISSTLKYLTGSTIRSTTHTTSSSVAATFTDATQKVENDDKKSANFPMGLLAVILLACFAGFVVVVIMLRKYGFRCGLTKMTMMTSARTDHMDELKPPKMEYEQNYEAVSKECNWARIAQLKLASKMRKNKSAKSRTTGSISRNGIRSVGDGWRVRLKRKRIGKDKSESQRKYCSNKSRSEKVESEKVYSEARR